MIFVDPGAGFASVVPSDRDHATAPRWLSQNTQPLLTTDDIIDETLTLLQARGKTSRAMVMGEQFFRGTLATVYYLTEADILLGWQTFRQLSDQVWSFTDCTRKVVIGKLPLHSRYAPLAVRIKTGIDARLGGKTLCQRHWGYPSWRGAL